MACSHVARRLAMCHGNNSPAFLKKKANKSVNLDIKVLLYKFFKLLVLNPVA